MPGTSLSAVRPALQTPAELLAAGRPADAAEALAAVVAETPTYAAAYVLLGVALDAAGRPDEALTAWHRAAFLVPRSPLVLRERQRLIDATRAAEPPAQSTEPPSPTANPSAQSGDGPLDNTEPDALPPLPPEDLPTIQTAPLDDFIFADSLADPDDGADEFDPDSFDFSAFDTDDDGESWLGSDAAPAAGGAEAFEPPAVEFPAGDTALGDVPADPFADWGEQPEPDTARILLPDGAVPDAPAPPAVDDVWAVFEDLPAPTASAAATPALADMLTPEGAPPTPDAETTWFADPSFAAATPLFHEPEDERDLEAEESDEPDPDGETDAVGPEPSATDGPVVPEPVEAASDDPSADAFASPSASVFAEPSAGTVADELDDLIASLETAPRIRPDPTFAGPAVHVPSADTGEMASETLARIYAAQHQFVQAALVYETLAAREPERAEVLLRQAAEMRARRP